MQVGGTLSVGLLGLCTLTDCCVFCCRSWTAVRAVRVFLVPRQRCTTLCTLSRGATAKLPA